MPPILFSYNCKGTQDHRILVHNNLEFNDAVRNAKPGHEAVLSNGIWNNTELLFEGNGTSEKPITLGAEEKGKVILSGASNPRTNGAYLVVKRDF